jgi:hypothetical protein
VLGAAWPPAAERRRAERVAGLDGEVLGRLGEAGAGDQAPGVAAGAADAGGQRDPGAGALEDLRVALDPGRQPDPRGQRLALDPDEGVRHVVELEPLRVPEQVVAGAGEERRAPEAVLAEEAEPGVPLTGAEVVLLVGGRRLEVDLRLQPVPPGAAAGERYGGAETDVAQARLGPGLDGLLGGRRPDTGSAQPLERSLAEAGPHQGLRHPPRDRGDHCVEADPAPPLEAQPELLDLALGGGAEAAGQIGVGEVDLLGADRGRPGERQRERQPPTPHAPPPGPVSP